MSEMAIPDWVAFLPEADRRAVADDSAAALTASSGSSEFTNLMEDWRNTAEIWSDSELARALSTPIDEPLDLPVEPA